MPGQEEKHPEQGWGGRMGLFTQRALWSPLLWHPAMDGPGPTLDPGILVGKVQGKKSNADRGV